MFPWHGFGKWPRIFYSIIGINALHHPRVATLSPSEAIDKSSNASHSSSWNALDAKRLAGLLPVRPFGHPSR